MDCIKYQLSLYKTKSVLLLLGDDFSFYHSMQQYKFNEKIIGLINKKLDYVEAKYSTLGNYLDGLDEELKERDLKLDEHSNDFLPMRSDTDQAWSGYYTTRPHLKRQIQRFSQFTYATLEQLSMFYLT